MSTYVMSDFHGRHDLFMAMLDKIGFSESDTLYILGDIADRGPSGIETYLYIMEKKNIFLIAGNHELLFLDADKKYRSCLLPAAFYYSDEWMLWRRNGGMDTWQAYRALRKPVREKLIDYLENAILAVPNLIIGNRNFYLCHSTHAERYLEMPLYLKDAKPEEAFRIVWDRSYTEGGSFGRLMASMEYHDLYTKYPPKTVMVFGHTPTSFLNCRGCDGRGRIWHGRQGHLIDIDCGCAVRVPKYAMLGCLRLEDMKEFYISGSYPEKHRKISGSGQK